MKGAHPYLNFPGNTEEAFNFYRSVFGGDFLGVIRFRDMGGDSMGIPETDLDKIMHIALPIGGGTLLMATDTLESLGQRLDVGNNVYINLDVESTEEAERLFDGLKAGGNVEMPLAETDWAETFGICKDQYGVQWMINYAGSKATSGAQTA